MGQCKWKIAHTGLVFFCAVSASPLGAQEGFELSEDGVVIDRAAQWEQWTRPKHAVQIDPVTHLVLPRPISLSTNAILDMADFQILIGNKRAHDKLLKDLNREGRPVPLNIRTAHASVAGVPIVYLKDKAKDNIKAGDPIIWFYYHGGIRQTGTNAEAAYDVLDDDSTTYWEPSAVVTRAEYNELSQGQRGPIYYLAQDESGRERRVGRATYDEAPSFARRIQYHSRSLDNWFVDIDLGRLVAVSKIVLRFVDGTLGEPFRQVRILGTASDLRTAPLSLIDRTITPNENQAVVEFDLDPEGNGVYRQLHILRIAVTASKFDKFKIVSEAEFAALPVEEQGGIDFHILNAAGGETKVEREVYDQVSPDRRGRLVHYQRERPRLAGVEVWSQGDNVALGIIDGGGSVELTGPFSGTPAFDGRYQTNSLQLVWSPDPRYDNRGIFTLDLGARFWLNYFRMVGPISGIDEMAVRVSDGTRNANGGLEWIEVHRQSGGTVESGLDRLHQVRFITTQIFTSQSGRAGGYNTGDRIHEIQLFGEGHSSEVTLTSPLIELPGSVILGSIDWQAVLDDPELVDVQIRTRTGDRLVEVTEYYGSGGEPKTEKEYGALPSSFQGPVVTRNKPGGGWSSWSQRYIRSGELVTSPSPRRYLQIQAQLLSNSPELAAGLRSIRVNFLPPVARQAVAELWPNNVTPGEKREFELYFNSTFVQNQRGGQSSRRFDEILIDATPIEAIDVIDLGLGREEDFENGTPRLYTEAAQGVDPDTGDSTPWFEDETGQRYKALIEVDSGDTLRIYPAETESGVLLRLPEKISAQPRGENTRAYYRIVLEEGEEVPVDRDGRILNELTYLGLPIDEQGKIVYFAIRGTDEDGKPIQETVDEFAYQGLEDADKGEIRFFRKLVGKGGESAYDLEGNPLTLETYNALFADQRGSVDATGELVRVRFAAVVRLNGTTVDAFIRDSAFPENWQQVDAGDATTLTPGAALSISVPFSARLIQDIEIGPNPFTPNDDGINDLAHIRFALGNLNIERNVRVMIFDLGGRRIWDGHQQAFGDQAFVWNGRDAGGKTVAPGVYLCKIEVNVDAESASHTSEVRLISVAY
jgi:hypothetical protein